MEDKLSRLRDALKEIARTPIEDASLAGPWMKLRAKIALGWITDPDVLKRTLREGNLPLSPSIPGNP